MLRSLRVGRSAFVNVRRFTSERTYEIALPEFTLHNLPVGPAQTTTTTKTELLEYYREMTILRRMEIECDNLYKAKFIRGFCHLYDGQEACSTGLEAGLIPGDSLITAYRDHCQAYQRGSSLKQIFSELLGRAHGSSMGKGGSMHFYNVKHEFYGGNGIVGAQVPVGVGVAFKHKYTEDGNVCVAMFGDGASNQGQIYEALNMAYLWKLPVIYVCENNHFGMGTSSERSSASTEYFRRGVIVPGIRVDGMDVFAVREAIKFSADHCRAGNGPMFLEFDTYRYHGHSMSDPGSSYRSREDITKVRETRDPIERVKAHIINLEVATVAELKVIDKEARRQVDEAVEFAKSAPYPEEKECYTQVYANNEVPIRAADGTLVHFH